eukprot:3127125-Rhodomonas_salina.1
MHVRAKRRKPPPHPQLFASDANLHSGCRGGIDPQVKNNWWRKSVSKRPALRMSEPAADGLFVADPLASSATNVIATPAIDPLETSSSTLVVQKERGIKKVFEDMATKMTIPQATALLIVVVALTGVSFPL